MSHQSFPREDDEQLTSIDNLTTGPSSLVHIKVGEDQLVIVTDRSMPSSPSNLNADGWVLVQADELLGAPNSSHKSAEGEMGPDMSISSGSTYNSAEGCNVRPQLLSQISEEHWELVQEPSSLSLNPPHISEQMWEELEKLTQEYQSSVLSEYPFKDFLISSETRNVKRGDDIFYPSRLFPGYNHHLLVTDVDENVVKYIDYNARPCTGETLLGSVQVGKAQTTFEELSKMKAMVRIWPASLERYDVETVIERAKSRKDKKESYDLLTNNCEHFVNWCKCGLNTSMQVTKKEKMAWYIARAGVIGASLIAIAFVV